MSCGFPSPERCHATECVCHLLNVEKRHDEKSHRRQLRKRNPWPRYSILFGAKSASRAAARRIILTAQI